MGIQIKAETANQDIYGDLKMKKPLFQVLYKNI